MPPYATSSQNESDPWNLLARWAIHNGSVCSGDLGGLAGTTALTSCEWTALALVRSPPRGAPRQATSPVPVETFRPDAACVGRGCDPGIRTWLSPTTPSPLSNSSTMRLGRPTRTTTRPAEDIVLFWVIALGLFDQSGFRLRYFEKRSRKMVLSGQ